MPVTKEFRCPTHGVFEQKVPMTHEGGCTCPECGAQAERVFAVPAIHRAAKPGRNEKRKIPDLPHISVDDIVSQAGKVLDQIHRIQERVKSFEEK